MIKFAFKNITRQRSRSLLTIIGIIIGIAAIISIGSISEGIQHMVEKETKLLAGKITVVEEGLGNMMQAFQLSEMEDLDVELISEVEGVEEVVPMITSFKTSHGFAGVPEYIFIGIEPKKTNYFVGEELEIEEGRELEEGDYKNVVIGKKYSDEHEYSVGDVVEVEDHEFMVIGVLEEAGNTDMDYAIITTLKTAKDVLDRETYSYIIVLPEDIDRAEEVAERIEEYVEGVEASAAKEISRKISEVIDRISFFTIGIASIAAVVGGLGVMNTMMMSVMERRREIGIMKAIGATKSFILLQILTEASIISIIGGLSGVILGYAGSKLISILTKGTIYGLITPRLILLGFGFATFLGLVGGIYPAYKAAKLDPVEALRYE